jgi:hypothetical protein
MAASMTPTRETTGIRTVAVRSPSIKRETQICAIVVFQIVFWSAVVIASTRSSAAKPAASLQADEVAFTRLDNDEQRIYRRALEGMQEIEDAKARTGEWPTVDELAKRGIPPFADDPIDTFGYRWQLVRDKYVINYVGIPTPSDRSTFVIALVVPEPGMEERVAVDETHHELNDGTMIHVGVYRGTARTHESPIKDFPFLDGWRRIAMGAP